MKSNKFAKIFLGLFFFTFTSFVIAGYAAQRTYIANPNIVQDLAKKYDVQINHSSGGIFITDGDEDDDFEKMDKTWDFHGHQADVEIDVKAANVVFGRSTDGKIHVIAEGLYNKNKSREIFKVEADSKKIFITDDGIETRDTKLTIQLPAPLATLKVKTISGEIILNESQANEAALHSVSGSLQLANTAIKVLNLESTSGAIEVRNKIPADITAQSVSGDISLHSIGLDQSAISTKTVSGDITNPYKNLDKSKNITTIITVSGDIELGHFQ